MIDISVIIVNWNTKDLLLDCIESIYKYTLHIKFEIIVVDNGSNDGSTEAIRAYFPEVTLICNNRNFGFAKANNIGIKASNGRFICLVNSDILILDNVLFKLTKFLSKNPRIGSVGPKTVNEDLTTRYNSREFPTLRNAFFQAIFFDKIFPRIKVFRGRNMYNFKHDITRPVDVLSGCFFMVRRRVVEQIGLLDEKYFIYGEDVDWCKRISKGGWDVYFFGDTKVIHYAGASSSAKKNRFLLEMLKSDLYYWRKHHNLIESTLYYLIIILKLSIRLFGWLIIYFVAPSKKENTSYIVNGYFIRIKWLIFYQKYSPLEFITYYNINN